MAVLKLLKFKEANGTDSLTDEISGSTWTKIREGSLAYVDSSVSYSSHGSLRLGQDSRYVSYLPNGFTGDFTYEFWFSVDPNISTANPYSIIASVEDIDNDYVSFSYDSSQTWGYFFNRFRNVNEYVYNDKNFYQPSGLYWNHAALCREGDYLKLYVNGILRAYKKYNINVARIALGSSWGETSEGCFYDSVRFIDENIYGSNRTSDIQNDLLSTYSKSTVEQATLLFVDDRTLTASTPTPVLKGPYLDFNESDGTPNPNSSPIQFW